MIGEADIAILRRYRVSDVDARVVLIDALTSGLVAPLKGRQAPELPRDVLRWHDVGDIAMLRFLWPILLMFGPQLGPRIVKFVRALWRLHRDSRVNLLIKLLIPLAVIYAIFPVDLVRDRIPYGLGRYDDLIILGLAVWLFWNLCPRAVVREHMGEPPPPRPEDRDPDSVVDGEARPTDDDDQRAG